MPDSNSDPKTRVGLDVASAIISQCEPLITSLEDARERIDKITTLCEYLPPGSMPGQDEFVEMIKGISAPMSASTVAFTILSMVLKDPKT